MPPSVIVDTKASYRGCLSVKYARNIGCRRLDSPTRGDHHSNPSGQLAAGLLMDSAHSSEPCSTPPSCVAANSKRTLINQLLEHGCHHEVNLPPPKGP
jgi:hypothetical protein